ncbi:golgin subfamily A member 4-like [Cuculus canorus]|uniref:golgin subfamily A member 4-like n=1 Tax=Cuculus canorus TaxID=55661 RepID=UPI0023AB11AD|nr:golgin subfamily A member 4-like [Cuculus canorus]
MAVKETISKAQEVEAELIENHHIETIRLHKKIAEKDDDLKRTVEKFEEILEAQLAKKTTVVNDSKRKEQELKEQIHVLEDQLKKYEKKMYITSVGTPYRGKGTVLNTDNFFWLKFMKYALI